MTSAIDGSVKRGRHIYLFFSVSSLRVKDQVAFWVFCVLRSAKILVLQNAGRRTANSGIIDCVLYLCSVFCDLENELQGAERGLESFRDYRCLLFVKSVPHLPRDSSSTYILPLHADYVDGCVETGLIEYCPSDNEPLRYSPSSIIE